MADDPVQEIVEDETPLDDTVECPSCGAEVSSTSEAPATCPQCGTDVSERPVTRDTDAPAPG